MTQVFYNVTQSRLVNSYGRFGGAYCLHLQEILRLLDYENLKIQAIQCSGKLVRFNRVRFKVLRLVLMKIQVF